jgi:two-component SAPR family response regulator
MGLIQENIGNYVSSKRNYLAVLQFWKSVENPFWLSNILNNLGVLYQMMGDYKEASTAFNQALAYSRSCGYYRMEAYILTGIGDIYLEIHEDEKAMHAYDAAEEIASKSQELFLQVYIKVQKASLIAYQRDFGKAHKMLDFARDLVKSGSSDMERNLIELEFSGIKIQENCAHEVLLSLEKTCEFFESGGHKIQYEKAHFYLLLGYISTNQHEKVIENLLHLLSSIQGEYPPASLIALASRYKRKLSDYSPSYLQSEYQLFTQLIEEFTEKLASLRRDIRKISTMVQFSEAAIKIRSFGRMEVSVQTHTITNSEWQTQAAKELFFLLLARPEGLTKEEISLIFWPDASYEESKFRFKNTIYRLRRAVIKEIVILDQNVYRFNNKINYEYDVELFLKENAVANQVQEAVGKLSHYREALKYYRGDYLAEIDSTWAMSPREYLRQIYLNILLQVSTIYFNQSNFEMAMDYCQRALSEDNLLEDAHRLAMKIYAAMGNRAGLVQQYQRCVEILEREINAAPSPQTLELFHNLLK